MKNYLITTITVLALSACMNAQPKPMVVPNLPLIAPKTSVNIEPGLIATCTPLQKLDPTKTYSQEDSLRVTAIWASAHDDCSKRFSKYVDLTSKALNINQVPSPVPASAPTETLAR